MRVKEQSQRQLQVAQEIRRILASLIESGEVRNLHEVNALVTISEVRVSPDLKYAFVYMITSVDSENKKALDALTLAANYLRKQVSKKMSLRYTPELVFKLDESFAAVDKIDKILNTDKVKKDLDK